jgi:hypothetical protein
MAHGIDWHRIKDDIKDIEDYSDDIMWADWSRGAG